MYGDNMSETTFDLTLVFGDNLKEVGLGKKKVEVREEDGGRYFVEINVAKIPNKPLKTEHGSQKNTSISNVLCKRLQTNSV